MLYLCFLP